MTSNPIILFGKGKTIEVQLLASKYLVESFFHNYNIILVQSISYRQKEYVHHSKLSDSRLWKYLNPFQILRELCANLGEESSLGIEYLRIQVELHYNS